MQEARILIMDDEAQERRRLEQYLGGKGYDVLAVGSVQDAVQAIKRERYDVFLTDCNIPGVDALRTSDEARKINPDMAADARSTLPISREEKSSIPTRASSSSPGERATHRCLGW